MNWGDSVVTGATIEDRIGGQYVNMSAKLRKAADYVARNPVDVATRSLRSVAGASGVSPATFSRLARVLGFEDYEAMREAGRAAVGQKVVPFSERAQSLRSGPAPERAGELLHRQTRACMANIAYLDQNAPDDKLEAAVDALHRAGRVLLLGAMGSAGLMEYFGYQAQWFLSNWRVAGRNGAATAAALTGMQPGDAVFVLSKAPYAARAINALAAARDRALTTVVITDSHASPALQFADHHFVVPTESPNFFSSYAATLVLLETIMSLLLTRAGPEAEERIRATEEQVTRLGENWKG